MSTSYFMPGEWRELASCQGLDGDIFFPKRGESIKAAQVICSECLVESECLQDAVDWREPAGIRGGISTKNRRKLFKDNPPPDPMRLSVQ